MTIYKNKKHSGIFCCYVYPPAGSGCLGKLIVFENLFTHERIGERPSHRKNFVDHLLTESGKWRFGDFYPVSV